MIEIDNKAIKIFDLVKEIVDILSTMNQDELKYLKLKYDIAFKSVELTNLKKKLKGSRNNE